MGDEPKFSEKWDFRRKEHSFDDSSSDDPDSNSTRDPINPNLGLGSNQINNGTKTVTTEQPAKTRKRRSKKDESKPEKAKQVRRRKPKTVCEEENKKKEETVMPMDDVGMFMKTLIGDLTASRESLMDWMKTELCGSDQNVASRPPLKKRAVAAVAAQRSGKKRMPKKKESEKQGKPDENGQEMNKPKETNPEIAQNGGDLFCNAGPLDRFLQNRQGGLGRNYFQQQQEGLEGIVAQTEMENEKSATVKNQKSIVLAIKAPKLSQQQKKTREANTNKNTSSMVERTRSETQKDHNFVIPIAPNRSSSPSLQSFPIGSSLNSFFPSSSQGITSLASNNNFQLRQPPVVSQIPDLSEFQTGFTGGQGFGNSMFHNNGYFSGFPAAFQPNLIAGGYNYPTQMSPATSSQQRDNNNMFGGLRVAGGAIRFSGGRVPESEVGNGINGLSNYRTSSGR